jgi:hypothetical protein
MAGKLDGMAIQAAARFNRLEDLTPLPVKKSRLPAHLIRLPASPAGLTIYLLHLPASIIHLPTRLACLPSGLASLTVHLGRLSGHLEWLKAHILRNFAQIGWPAQNLRQNGRSVEAIAQWPARGRKPEWAERQLCPTKI